MHAPLFSLVSFQVDEGFDLDTRPREASSRGAGRISGTLGSMAKSGLAAAGAAGGPKPSSNLGRLARFGVSLYILAAIVYTAYHLVVVPVVSYVSQPSSSSLARLDQQPPAPRAVLHEAGLQADRAASARGGPSAVEGTESTSTSSKNRHAALETAGVRAADIRSEDSRDPVWAAAESADKKGAKKAKPGVYHPPEKLLDGRELVRTRVHGFDGVDWDKDQVVWHHPSADLAHSGPNSPKRTLKLYGNNPRGVKTTSEDELLSLSFGSSLQPSKVIPYYYRATEPDRPDFNTEDITITTLVTSNRFTVFERLVERYQGASFCILATVRVSVEQPLTRSSITYAGPVSATVHLTRGKAEDEMLRALDKLYTGSPVMRKYVDVHLVYDSFDRQFNMWRNVAKFFARTEVRRLDEGYMVTARACKTTSSADL